MGADQRKLEWQQTWLAGGSRNLSWLHGAGEQMMRTLHVDQEAAVKAMTALPGTKHDIGGSPEKFVVDAFPVSHGEGQALFVTIHGQFTERAYSWVRVRQCVRDG